MILRCRLYHRRRLLDVSSELSGEVTGVENVLFRFTTSSAEIAYVRHDPASPYEVVSGQYAISHHHS
jgi:hypothetical protein